MRQAQKTMKRRYFEDPHHAFLQSFREKTCCCIVHKIQRFVHVMQEFLQNAGLSMIQYDSSKIELDIFSSVCISCKN